MLSAGMEPLDSGWTACPGRFYTPSNSWLLLRSLLTCCLMMTVFWESSLSCFWVSEFPIEW